MSKAPLFLIALGVVAASAAPLLAAPGPHTSRFTVSVQVVSACGVRVDGAGTADVRCTRGGADRFVVQASQPKVVTLERDASKMMTAQVQAGQPAGGSERVVTLQF